MLLLSASLAMTPLLNYSGTALAGNTFVTICQHLIYVRKVRTYFQRTNVSFAYSWDAEWSRAWWLQFFFNIPGFSRATLVLPEYFCFPFRKKSLGVWFFFLWESSGSYFLSVLPQEWTLEIAQVLLRVKFSLHNWSETQFVWIHNASRV